MKSSYTDSLAHTTFECKYHIVFAPKFRRKFRKFTWIPCEKWKNIQTNNVIDYILFVDLRNIIRLSNF